MSVTAQEIYDGAFSRLRVIPVAIKYLAEILKEEGIQINMKDYIYIDSIRCLVGMKYVTFFWAEEYPTYFAAYVNNYDNTVERVLSFATGSEEIREYIRNIKISQ